MLSIPKNISIGSGIIAVRAAQLLEEGMGFEELCRKTEEMIPNSKVFFCLKTLEYLQKVEESEGCCFSWEAQSRSNRLSPAMKKALTMQ